MALTKFVNATAMFEPSPGSDLADYATALVGIARCTFQPVRGKFNDTELHAWPNSSVEQLLGQFWTDLACKAQQERIKRNNPDA